MVGTPRRRGPIFAAEPPPYGIRPLLGYGAARLRLGTAAARHPYPMANERAAARKRDEKRVDDFPISRIPADEEKFFAQVLGLVLGHIILLLRHLRLGNRCDQLLLGPLALDGHTRRAEGEE